MSAVAEVGRPPHFAEMPGSLSPRLTERILE